MNWFPKNYTEVNGVLYRLDSWHYSNDYETAICTYVVDDPEAFVDEITVTEKVTGDV